METLLVMLAVLLLTGAATAAVLATPRALPRLAPRWGVPALLVAWCVGVLALRPMLGWAEAIAWSLAALGVLVPLVSGGLAARSRSQPGLQTRGHGRGH